MHVGWVYHEFFKHHWTGISHPDQAARLDVIVEALQAAGLLSRMKRLAFEPASFDQLTWVHEPAYVDLVRMAAEQGFGFIGDRDTRLCPESYDVAALASGGVLAACAEAMRGGIRRAFCAVRPPGHHAEPDRAMGFCLFNHVAVAAEYLGRRHGLERVAIVDFDVHHGNGTQRIFEERNDVLYISLHEHPLSLSFPGTGYRSETGQGPGEGYTINIYIAHGGDELAYRRAFEERVHPALEGYAPQFLLLSTGFDAQGTEPAAHVNLKPESFGWITRELVRAADEHCEGRLVSVLEGGYELGNLGRCAVAHVRALMEET